MNPVRRSFLKLLASAGAVAASTPTLARADRIRILPDGGTEAIAHLVPGQRSPELGRALGGLALGPAAVQGGLAVLWLHAKDTTGGPPLEILTLDESRARGALTVIERAQASVPELIAENRGKTYVLLLAGEILIGGKQNRVLREDLLLPPLSGPRNIAVYCVEQGRWNEGRKDFDSRGSVVQPSVRSEVLRKADQSRIWSGVAAASRSMAAPSATGSYQAIYDKPEVKVHLEHTTRSFDPTVAPTAVGAAVFVGPNLAGVDCFHAPGLFAREWPKLLRAYALDAYGTGAGAWDEAAARARTDGLLRAAARVEGGVRGSVGAGRLFEFTLDGRRGAALLFESQAIHLAIL
jgi:ARG/rhodanese/phosphatase superfamily protein